MAIFIRLGSVAFITAGVPFELSIPPLELPKPCYCLPSARSFLIRLVSECLSYESAVSQYIKDFGPGKVQPLFTAQMYTLQSKLCEWKHNFDQLSINESTRLSDLGIKSTLLMIYHSLFILVSSSLRKQETEYDQFLDSFQSIVDHGESAVSATTDLCGSNPHFTFEIGVGMPLLVTALKCRDSSIRYKALSLLRRCPSTQGFYMVSHGSALAAKAIEIEESLGCNPANPDRIDEETSRLQYMTVYPQDPDFSLLVARKQPASETSGLNELTLVETRVFLSQEIAALR
ncbi:C6 finger domain protein [Penicillium angulare]|uniref:C6 finger domain protein n=1 Tax=Penicillium angulare TaxID=116970 RepID=A0A9W9EVI8_9EURO|nr:C6 finger domain protein [Penicillium angulare]